MPYRLFKGPAWGSSSPPASPPVSYSGGADLARIEAEASQAGMREQMSAAEQVHDWNVDDWRRSSQFNSAEAQKNRDFQRYMSSTAHQREVADLLAAGLNPILTATGGNGASTPTGSMASAQQVHSENYLKDNPYKNVATSAHAARELKIRTRELEELNLKRLENETKRMAVQNRYDEFGIKHMQKQMDQIETQTGLMRHQHGVYDAQIARELAMAGQAAAAAQLSHGQLAHIQNMTPYEQALMDQQAYNQQAQAQSAYDRSWKDREISNIFDTLKSAMFGNNAKRGEGFFSQIAKSTGGLLPPPPPPGKDSWGRNVRKR